MAEIMMMPIAPSAVGDRNVVNTGVSTVGRGGDDYFCGHCGRKIIQSMDLSRFDPAPIFQCGACQGHNEAPAVEAAAETEEAPA